MKQISIGEAFEMLIKKIRPFILELEKTLELSHDEKERLESLLCSDVETLLMIYTTMSPKLHPFRVADTETNHKNFLKFSGEEKSAKITLAQWEKIEKIWAVIDKLLKDIN